MDETNRILDFCYNNDEYCLDMKIIRDENKNPDSDKLFIQVSLLYDVHQWKIIFTEDELISKNKNWRICIGIDSVYAFIRERIMNKDFEIVFSTKLLTFVFNYVNSFQKAKLSISLDESSSNLELCVSSQASSIKILKEKLKNLEMKYEFLENEIKQGNQIQIIKLSDKLESIIRMFEEKLISNNTAYEEKIDELVKMIPTKPNSLTIFDCGYESGTLSFYLSSWQIVPRAKGSIFLKNKTNLFWECYISSLHCNNTNQVSLRIEIKNTGTGEIEYWPKNSLGYIRTYVPATYFPDIKFSGTNMIDSGNYEIQLQIMYSSNSSSHPLSIYGGKNGGEIKMNAIYFDA